MADDTAAVDWASLTDRSAVAVPVAWGSSGHVSVLDRRLLSLSRFAEVSWSAANRVNHCPLGSGIGMVEIGKGWSAADRESCPQWHPCSTGVRLDSN